MLSHVGVDKAKEESARKLRKQVLGLAVSVVAILLAVLHLLKVVELDAIAAILLLTAALPWMQSLLKSLELFGVKVTLQDLQDQIGLIEDNSALPGSKGAVVQPPVTATEHAREKPLASRTDDKSGTGTPQDDWKSDPNRGRFGGSPESNGRILEAVIRPASTAESAACKIKLMVRSTDPARPLTGKVKLYLHPTFRDWREYDVDVKKGIATDTITSWGVFTVGAEADEGQTRLELNLKTVPGGTTKFYLN